MKKKETIGIKDKVKARDNIEQIDQNMYCLSKEIKSLSENLKTMMSGNFDGPYWNGTKAKNFYKVAVKNLESMVKDYQVAYLRLSSYAERYKKATK